MAQEIPMVSGWFVFAVVASIIICCGFVIAVALLKAAWAQREREALSSNDLRALEESALILIDKLKSEADAGIAVLDARCAELKKLIAVAEERLALLQNCTCHTNDGGSQTLPQTSDFHPRMNLDESSRKILDMASAGIDSAEMARVQGADCAEVKLMLRLAKKQSATLDGSTSL